MTDNVPALPDDFVKSLMTGIAESRASTMLFGGKPLLRMLKSGSWVFGQSNDEVQEGSHWAVNPVSLKHGWSCWVDGGPNGKNTLEGEVMSPMTEPLPPKPAPIGRDEYKPQRECELKCLDGDDAGTEVRYKLNSLGGMKAFDGLIGEIQKRAAAGERRYLAPAVTFSNDSYIHGKYGEVLTPVLTIAYWVDVNGNPPDVAAAAPQPVAAPQPAAVAPAAPAQPARRRKAPLNAAPAPAPAPVAPVATAQAHAAPMPPPVGQRRRPMRPTA